MSTVNVTPQTIEVLKNFENVNKSIMVRKGNLLNSRSIGQNIIAEYECEEEFPQTFAVYELSQFLNGLMLFEKAPALEFANDEFVKIRSQTGKRSAKYFFSDPAIVEEASPGQRVRFPEEDVVMEFRITSADLTSIYKASGIYELTNVKIQSDSDGVTLTAFDPENETNNTYSLSLSGSSSAETSVNMAIENIRPMPGDYDVSITDGVITRWKHTTLDLVYYIAVEPDNE